jgi:hypothetical protein
MSWMALMKPFRRSFEPLISCHRGRGNSYSDRSNAESGSVCFNFMKRDNISASKIHRQAPEIASDPGASCFSPDPALPGFPRVLTPDQPLGPRSPGDTETLSSGVSAARIACQAQTHAPYVRGRLVITPLGDGRFTVEVTRGADKCAIRA